MKYLIGVLSSILVALLIAGNFYWRRAYTDKPFVVLPQKTEYIGTGVLRYNREQPFHVIVGYEAENCKIEAPPDHNVIAYVNAIANEHAKMSSVIELKP